MYTNDMTPEERIAAMREAEMARINRATRKKGVTSAPKVSSSLSAEDRDELNALAAEMAKRKTYFDNVAQQKAILDKVNAATRPGNLMPDPWTTRGELADEAMSQLEANGAYIRRRAAREKLKRLAEMKRQAELRRRAEIAKRKAYLERVGGLSEGIPTGDIEAFNVGIDDDLAAIDTSRLTPTLPEVEERRGFFGRLFRPRRRIFRNGGILYKK